MERNFKIDSFLRYILNNTDSDSYIKEGYKSNIRNTTDYVNQYDLYFKNSFDNISNYISSLFKHNNLSIEQHYEKMLIKREPNLKGIYKYLSEEDSMEDDILHLFLNKVGEIPIAQNILISNKETSYEEIQAFFHRAILCKYHTLFVVEINNSFSDYQQRVMNNFINNVLTYKHHYFNDKEQKDIEKSSTNTYMDSCLVFIYNKNSESFLNELQKFEPNSLPNINKEENIQNKLFDNIHIVSSEICGLGKSTKIKNDINNSKKKYIYFPLGGNITKDKIFMKLKTLLRNIKTENDYKDYAIHLDLHENKEPSVLNEFLFSMKRR